MQKVEIRQTTPAAFDPIHHPQQLFRLLMDTMARPGTVKSIGGLIEGGLSGGEYEPVASVLAVTLLDSEVKFMQMHGDPQATPSISLWERATLRKTYARCVAMAQADYVFAWDADVLGGSQRPVPQKNAMNHWIQTVGREGRLGTLSRPDQSATLILGVVSVSETKTSADDLPLELSGPGVNGTAIVYVSGLDKRWLEARQRWNQEFPKGMDWVLFTADGRLMSLPRSTRVRWEEQGSWHMSQ